MARTVSRVSKHDAQPTPDEACGVDPIDFLRAALKISPEDAARVREDAAHNAAPGAAPNADKDAGGDAESNR